MARKPCSVLRRIEWQAELEADVLAWVIANSTTEEAVNEALKDVAGAQQCQQLRVALCQLAVKDKLCKILENCFTAGVVTICGSTLVEASLLSMSRLLLPPTDKLIKKPEFRAAIAGAIPHIVILLKDSDSDVLSSTVSLLGKVSEKGGLNVEPSLQWIIGPGEGFRARAASQAAIAAVILDILALVKDSNSDIRSRTASSCHLDLAEFQAAIAPVIPDIVALLKDFKSDV
ncbi:hypothetical protein BU17DRAFT_81048 [Hysterangium stoloniferum]|nr:hypothetical protein BU17DRAFT_81048 [Hysterangium stoloniferum]